MAETPPVKSHSVDEPGISTYLSPDDTHTHTQHLLDLSEQFPCSAFLTLMETRSRDQINRNFHWSRPVRYVCSICRCREQQRGEATCRWSVIPVMMVRYSKRTLSTLPIKPLHPSWMWLFPVLFRSRVVLAQWHCMFIRHHRGSRKNGLNQTLRPWGENVFYQQIDESNHQMTFTWQLHISSLPFLTFCLSVGRSW